jgi:hypothetical protein
VAETDKAPTSVKCQGDKEDVFEEGFRIPNKEKLYPKIVVSTNKKKGIE